MKNKSIKKNYVYNLCYQVLLMIAPLITTPYLSRVLGADGVGTVSYAESIVAYFVVAANLGITIFGQREISYVQDDRVARSEVFWSTKALSLITSTIALFAYIVISQNFQTTTLYLVLAFNILSVAADVTWFFQGMEEFGKIVLRNFVFKLINITYIFVFIKRKEDFILYALGIGLFLFVSNCSLWAYLPKYIDKPNFRKIKPFRNIKTIISLFIPTIAIQVYAVLDKTMIGIITKNAFENGYYEQAMKMSKMVLTIVTSLGAVMIPRIGYYFGKKETEKVVMYMYKGYQFVWFMGIPLTFGMIGISQNLVPWFYGEGYGKVVPLMCILSFLIIAIGTSNITGLQYLVPTKRQNYLTISVVSGAAINFICNIVFISKFGAIGAAVASVIAESTVAIVQLWLIRKELSIKIIIWSAKKYVIAGGLMLITLLLIRNSFFPSVFHTLILIVTGAIIYLSVLLLLRDDFLRENMNNVISKLRKR